MVGDSDAAGHGGVGRAGDRGVAVCDFGARGRGGTGGGALHGRWVAADDRQCVVARHLLPHGRSGGVEPAARDDFEDLVAGGGVVRVVCCVAQYGEHFVSGGGGVFAGGVELFSGTRVGRVLEAHDEAGGGGGDGRGARRVRVLHRLDVSVLSADDGVRGASVVWNRAD